MEAIIPVGSSRDGDTGNLNPAEAKLISDLATAGHIEAFRQIIRKIRNMRQIKYFLQQYIFARQVHILFILKLPEAVINRFDSFMRFLHRSKLEKRDKDDLDFDVYRAHVDAWAVGACWDLKCAFDEYLSITISDLESPQERCDDEPMLQQTICSLRKVLNFGRLCYRRLGGLQFGRNNLIHDESLDHRSRSKMVPWVK